MNNIKNTKQSVDIPEIYITKTLDIIKSAIVYYYINKTNYDSDTIKNFLGNINYQQHFIVNTSSDLILATTIQSYPEDFNYPKFERPYYYWSNYINVRIEISFSQKNESSFNVEKDNNDNNMVRMRFNIYSIINTLNSMIQKDIDENKIDSIFTYYSYTVRHEWIHFIQSFILHPQQKAMKSNYSLHGNDYYTSYAERLPMLESACGEFETVISGNEFWGLLSKEDKMKFVRQFTGLSEYEKFDLTINNKLLKFDAKIVKPHKLFLAYKHTKPTTYHLIIKKFIGMIEKLL